MERDNLENPDTGVLGLCNTKQVQSFKMANALIVALEVVFLGI